MTQWTGCGCYAECGDCQSRWFISKDFMSGCIPPDRRRHITAADLKDEKYRIAIEFTEQQQMAASMKKMEEAQEKQLKLQQQEEERLEILEKRKQRRAELEYMGVMDFDD